MNEPQLSPPPGAQRKNGLAVTSLVLGILAIPCSILAGIPAIITGHIARGRAVRQPELYGGAGKALAGLIMGYISIGLAILIIPLSILGALLLPALAKAKGKAQTVNCVNNLKQIALAARMYAGEHNDTFPPDFLTMSNDLFYPKVLACPSDTNKIAALDWAEFDARLNVSYEFLLPKAKDDNPQAALARCPIHGNTAFADGSVHSQPRP